MNLLYSYIALKLLKLSYEYQRVRYSSGKVPISYLSLLFLICIFLRYDHEHKFVNVVFSNVWFADGLW